MKRSIVLFLVFLYLGTATGVTLHLHYCMGEMVNLELADSSNDHCDNCGMEKSQSTKNGCCKDELKKIQTDDSRKITEDSFKSLSNYVAILLQVQEHEFISNRYDTISGKLPWSNGPPRTENVAIYILNCSYLI